MKKIISILLILSISGIAFTQEKKSNYFHITPVCEYFGGIHKFSTLDTINTNFNYFSNVGLNLNFNLNNKFAINYMPRFYFFKLNDLFFSTVDKDKLVLNSIGLKHKGNLAMTHSFNITYQVFEFLKLEIANGKNFIGDGFRSLFLSENATNYPYFKIETQFAFIKYIYIWAAFSGYEQGYDREQKKYVINGLHSKYSAIHYLDIAIGKKLKAGIFESVTSRKVVLDYFNPVVFFRPVEYSLGKDEFGDDNIMLGLNLKYNFYQKYSFYSQFLLDDIIVKELINDVKHSLFKYLYKGQYGWFANKWGLQFGINGYDIFTVKKLDIFTEINMVRPYVYTHNITEENYTHNGQALAHTLGANFVESVSGINYDFNQFRINTKIMYAVIGKDKNNSTNVGQNIFVPVIDAYHGNNIPVNPYYNVLLQGLKTSIITFNPEVSYFIKRHKDLSINIGYLYRIEKNDNIKEVLNFVYCGFRYNIVHCPFSIIN